MESNPVSDVYKCFTSVFESKSSPIVSKAPGRVNLIGEHTDYNDGFVFPMAIDKCVAVAIRPRTDTIIRAHSIDYDETKYIDMNFVSAPGGTDWFDYVVAVAWAMRDSGLEVPGADMVVAGNVPLGAGLSSSAALELAVARALSEVGDFDWDPVEMAKIGQIAENRFVGVNCGIMDQFASALCKREHALLLDCRTLKTESIRIPDSATIVVMDTGVRRTLAGSEYNERRASCETAVQILAKSYPTVTTLRDVDLQMLASAENALDRVTYRRAKHVIAETARPVRLAELFRVGDLESAGILMNESHDSLRDFYEVSCDELDLITSLAQGHSRCYGARMTGAGFGGCAVALVNSEGVKDFLSYIKREYRPSSDICGRMYSCKPSHGATIVKPD